jgi:hypothetical protein
MKEKFPSHIVKMIVPALNRVNKFAEFQVTLTVEQSSRGQALLSFEKKAQGFQQVLPGLEEQATDVGLNALNDLLPPAHKGKKTILDLVEPWYQQFGLDYVSRNIRYTINHSKGNFRVYLQKALKADWGLALEEDEAAEKKARETAKETAVRKEKERVDRELKTQEERENLKRARVYQQSLPDEALADLRKEAIARLDPGAQEAVKKQSPGHDLLIKMMMDKITLEKLGIS